MHARASRYIGLLYVTPALAFVLVFTVYPLAQMMWMSLHNWSLIAPKKYIGFGNFAKAWNDPQVWTSLEFTLKYTAIITPILMILGYLAALLTAENRPLRQFTRSVIFAPVVIGLGASSLLWYWLFSYDFGLINRALIDLGVIARPVVWFGADADVAMWAVIASIVWKVVGFGTILFVAAIHAIPTELSEAAMVDGASYWQRVRKITLPLTAKTILLVTLVSIIGSLLAFDQFYIMTAGQPRNLTATSVFMIYLNSFPYLKLGYGAALSLILAGIILVCTVLQMLLSRRSHA
ncbi:carbohydrate ABC transporter permease [Mesorhizobium sp. ZC-5]|jgi:multiple sugar transport system permease protein|uniref:carbohydrate ABC transporter permease n=1 Tax=Mesorhizobium sp. ZC-5 TaxID=2986066 RepID=UPI0021E93B93|nr:sugar ABC transporter permease [Mesorhizobium sp. ZC-5]MCV3239163.1 sugar ABC transporter permease [Mesorhizobium sp. ZC-5]